MMTGIILIIPLKNATCDFLPKIVNKKEFLVTKPVQHRVVEDAHVICLDHTVEKCVR